MTTGIIRDAQRRAAKIVGLSYLLALFPAVFAEFYVRTMLFVPGDPVQTAQRIVAHERLFRLGIASSLSVFALDVALITALYVVLEPIQERLALLAMGWGLVETATLVVVTLHDLDVLRILSGAVPLGARPEALATLSLGAHDAAYRVGLVFAGLRSTAFCYLWMKSRYVPRALAAWGMVASSVMGACSFLLIIFPGLAKVVPVVVYGGPIFFFELAMGGWLVLKGLRPAPSAPA